MRVAGYELRVTGCGLEMKDKHGHPQMDGSKRLLETDTFRFDCHPQIPCFTRCCQDADMYLYPYDIIRLKNCLSISSERFLERYTLTAFRDNPYFPSLMLKMSPGEEKSCPFLARKGCTVYEDRPFSCRAYPLERAVARSGAGKKRAVHYFLACHDHCWGHKEPGKWSVDEWIKDQQIQIFNDMNDLWVEVDTLFRGNPWGRQGVDGPAFKMAFMACFNIDKFKTFVFESTFLSRFDVSPERIDKLTASDVELMKFGFDWIKLFLTGTGPLTLKK